MGTIQKILSGMMAALVAIGMLVFIQPSAHARQIEISYADLQASLNRELSRSPVVGFLPRVEFRHLTVRFAKEVVLEGSGRWFSLGAGGYTHPDITISARLPTEASAWSVSDGAIRINQVQITRAFREPHGTTVGRYESEANVQGWQDRLSEFIRRLDVFADEALLTGKWRVVSVQSGPDGLIFSLEE